MNLTESKLPEYNQEVNSNSYCAAQYNQQQHHHYHLFPQSIPTPPLVNTPASSVPSLQRLLIPEVAASTHSSSFRYSPNSSNEAPFPNIHQPCAIRHDPYTHANPISLPMTPSPTFPVALPSIRDLLNHSNTHKQLQPLSNTHTPKSPSVSLSPSAPTSQPQRIPPMNCIPYHQQCDPHQIHKQQNLPLTHDLNRSNSFQQYQQLQPLTVSTLQQQHQIEVAHQQQLQLQRSQSMSPDRNTYHSKEIHRDLSVSRKKRQNLPRQTTLALLNWLSEHLDRPYPSSREKYELLNETKLTIQQLDNWFINARRRKISILRKLKENDQNIALSF